jgi:hypothetical protein
MAGQEDERDGESDLSIEMDHEPQISGAERYAFLAGQMHDPGFRHAYASGLTREFIARQFKTFRGDRSQTEFGKLIDQKQSRISQLEDPNYGRETFQTCFEIAEKLDVAFFGCFFDWPTFLRLTCDLSDETAHPQPYRQEDIEKLATKAQAAATEERPAPAVPGGTLRQSSKPENVAALSGELEGAPMPQGRSMSSDPAMSEAVRPANQNLPLSSTNDDGAAPAIARQG